MEIGWDFVRYGKVFGIRYVLRTVLRYGSAVIFVIDLERWFIRRAEFGPRVVAFKTWNFDPSSVVAYRPRKSK